MIPSLRRFLDPIHATEATEMFEAIEATGRETRTQRESDGTEEATELADTALALIGDHKTNDFIAYSSFIYTMDCAHVGHTFTCKHLRSAPA